jgi:Zn-dependent peptidase ImmA (M78 family)
MEEQNNKPRIKFAQQTAKKLLADIGINTPPILIRDVINYIKKQRDLSIYPWAFGDDTDGIQVSKGDAVAIGYNESQHPHRQRFTVAHEVGHLLLGHTEKNFVLDLKSKKPEEVEANQFAAELLMPLDMVKKDVQNRIAAKDMASKYNVSEEALWWKLYECNLFKKIA